MSGNDILPIYDIALYLSNLKSEADYYEQNALELFDMTVGCKSTIEHKQHLCDFINNTKLISGTSISEKKIDIWALSTKCVTYPKPLDLYLIGNGNGNADDIIKNIMCNKQNGRLLSFHKQMLYFTIKQNIKGIKALLKYVTSMQYHCENIFDINYQDKNTGLTALHIAIANKSNVKLIKFLITNGSSIDIKDHIFGRTPIHYAVQTIQYDIIECVLKYVTHIQIDLLDNFDMSPLCIYYDQLNQESDLDNIEKEIEHLLINKGAKYCLLRPFIQKMETKFGNKFCETKNKIYRSIEIDTEIIKQENIDLKNDIAEIIIENENLKNDMTETMMENKILKKNIDKLHKTYHDQHVVDTTLYKQQIEELRRTYALQQKEDIYTYMKNMDEYVHTINIQENIIEVLSDQFHGCELNHKQYFTYINE